MNERIKELAVQAKEYARSHVADCRRFGYYMEYNEYELRFEKKFAELLVRECAEVIDDGRFSVMECEGNSHRVSYNNGIYYALSSVKKHFGVEE
jgi:hypothetical protein